MVIRIAQLTTSWSGGSRFSTQRLARIAESRWCSTTELSCKSMVAGVRCMSFDFQVFRVVVGPDLILVVNRLTILQEPPNLHFRYDLMDINVSGAPCARVVGAVDNPIPSRG